MTSRLKIISGFFLNSFGIIWSGMNEFVCDYICKIGCTSIEKKQCDLILLFVGIIFIVCGYALIMMKNKEDRKRLKKDIKRKIHLFSEVFKK